MIQSIIQTIPDVGSLNQIKVTYQNMYQNSACLNPMSWRNHFQVVGIKWFKQIKTQSLNFKNNNIKIYNFNLNWTNEEIR